MKRYVQASYEVKFWELHDKDMETGLALEEIIDDLGWEAKFFPYEGDPIEAEEADYKEVLDEYNLRRGGVNLLAQTTDGKWVEIFSNISEEEADAIWRAGFATGQNRFSIETAEGKRVHRMNMRTLSKEQ